jgi:hypothetical protein
VAFPACARAAAVLAATSIGCAASAQDLTGFPPPVESQAAVFAGRHVDNVWEDAFLRPGQLEWGDAGMVGIAYGRNWQIGASRFSWGYELQAVSQFGSQQHLEFNAPVTIRYHVTPRVPFFRSLAFGLGPSLATEVPEYEVETRGDSQRLLAYWLLEAEFGRPDWRNTIFTRLHHRSGAFGSVANEGSSNVITWGLRHRW